MDNIYINRITAGTTGAGTGREWEAHGTANWIEFRFDELVLVTSLQIYNRCSYGDQCTAWEITYSDSSMDMVLVPYRVVRNNFNEAMMLFQYQSIDFLLVVY